MIFWIGEWEMLLEGDINLSSVRLEMSWTLRYEEKKIYLGLQTQIYFFSYNIRFYEILRISTNEEKKIYLGLRLP